MENQIKELQKWLETASSYELPAWNNLPAVPLYMEQVIQYINDSLKPLSPNDKYTLTSFMVNNYVKAGMIKMPDKKKYNVEHLGYLFAITTLKETLSMSELNLLIDMDGQISNDKSLLYGFFRTMSKDVTQEKAKAVKEKMDVYERGYLRDKKNKNPKAEDNLRGGVALTAFRLAIQSQVDKLISEALINALADDMHGPKERALENIPGHKEAERERKISEAESHRLALAKEVKMKEEKANQKKAQKAKKEKKK